MNYLRFFFSIFLILIPFSSYSQILESDSLALVALYDSTDGANWEYIWDLNSPVDTWSFVTVNNGRVEKLDAPGMNLVGSIPPELGNLTDLQWLRLPNNDLTGSIPAELGNLNNLTILFLYYNQLTGSIPVELGNLVGLEDLNLGGNLLTGSIPTELGSLTNLSNLNLQLNQLTGSIPAELGNLLNLDALTLGSNLLSGTIPPELGNLTNLRQIELWSNQITGSIPSELGNLTNLGYLYLQSNKLSGLPDFSTLISLSYLKVENNKLTFGDLEPNMNVASTSFTYTPQDSVGNDSVIVVGQDGNLSLSIPVSATANVYQWMKDGNDIPEATGDTLSISHVEYADSGSYVLRITNTIVTDLTLYSRPMNVIVIKDLAIRDEHPLPKQFSLHNNYPNPFNPSTRIEIDLPSQTQVSLNVYDIMGREVSAIVNESMVAGYHRLAWNGRSDSGQLLPSGIYIARLVTPEYNKSIKMVLMK